MLRKTAAVLAVVLCLANARAVIILFSMIMLSTVFSESAFAKIDITKVGEWTLILQTDRASGYRHCSFSDDYWHYPGFSFRIGAGPSKTSLQETISSGVDIYPGSTMYFSDGNSRFSGNEEVKVTNEIRGLLVLGGTFYVSWVPWPSGGRTDKEIKISNFEPAYQACKTHVLGSD